MPNPMAMPSGPNVPTNQNGFPAQDPTVGLSQRLEQRLNPKIGVPGQDSDTAGQAAFMMQADPQGAVKLAQTIMQAVQQKMMQARQAMMAQQAQQDSGMMQAHRIGMAHGMMASQLNRKHEPPPEEQLANPQGQ